MKVGLVTTLNGSGLGMIGHDIILHMDVDSIFVIPHPVKGTKWKWVDGLKTVTGSWPPTKDEIQDYLTKYTPDVLIFLEYPYNWDFPRMAHAMGIKVAWVPMLDSVGTPWLEREQVVQCISMFMAPTKFAHTCLTGKGYPSVYTPWPVDTEWFKFIQRKPGEKITLIHNAGYVGANLTLPRKGTDLVLSAFHRVKNNGFKLIVRSQDVIDSPLLTGVDYRQGELMDERSLYAVGDVYLAPSRMEGLGLPIGEAMASGMPVITTDGSPMNEKVIWKDLLIKPASETLRGGNTDALVIEPDLDDFVEKILGLRKFDLEESSRMMRARIEENFSWKILAPKYITVLKGLLK